MNDSTRRTFLFQLSSLGAAMVVSGRAAGRQQLDLPTRSIPSSGERLPIVGVGSSKAVLQIPERGVDPIASVLRRFAELGGRVVDTSPRSADIDEEFGRVLQDPLLRDSLFVAAKINTTGRDSGIEQFRQTQRLFGRRTLDVVQIESLRDADVHWPSVLGWKETGEARYIGVTASNDDLHGPLESFMRRAPLDFVQVNYSVVETSAEERVLPLAGDRGIAVMTNRPFMNGNYFPRVSGKPLPEWAAEFDCTSWAQFSLKYILANPVVTVALTETTSPVHIEENLRAALGHLPDEPMRARMKRYMRSL